MPWLRSLLAVARTERKLLVRSTRFRVLGGLGVAFPVGVGGLFTILETQGLEIDPALGLSGYMPFYIFSYVQTIVVVFVAGNFRDTDVRCHVEEVLAARPLSTTELVLGKYLGLLQALLGLTLAVMGLTLAIQAAKVSITDAPFELAPYASYLFLMTLPGLLYMSALTFFLGALLRQRMAATLVSIAYVVGVLFFLGDRYDGIFDFGAFFAPLFWSDIIGLGEIGPLVVQRLAYVALAVALLGLSIQRYPRLAQRSAWNWVGRGLAVAGLVVAVGLGARLVRAEGAAEAYRQRLLALQTEVAGEPAARAVHYDLDVELLGRPGPLAATARVRLANPHDVPLERLILSLNPGLELRSVQAASGSTSRQQPADDRGTGATPPGSGTATTPPGSDTATAPRGSRTGATAPGSGTAATPPAPGAATTPGRSDLTWERRESVVDVALPAALQPGEEIDLELSYDGDIDRDAFDLIRTEPRIESEWPFRKADLTAWIRDGSAFLPPRSGWYPAPGVDYGHESPPAPSFFTARVAVTLPAGLEVVTQGRPVEVPRRGEDAGADRRTHVWAAEVPVPVLSLNAGAFDVAEGRLGDVDVALLLHPAHSHTVEFFDDARDEVLEAMERMLEAMEQETGLPYPYPRLSVVEVPFQIQWYYEGWREVGGLTQPAVLMLEEDVLLEQSFSEQLASRERRARGELDVVRTKRDLLLNAVFRAFLSPEGSQSGLFRSPLVQLWSYGRGFGGDNAALLERGLPLYLQEDVTADLRTELFSSGRGRRGFGGRRGRGDNRVVGEREEPEPRLGGLSRPRDVRSTTWDDLIHEMQQRPFAEMEPGDDPDLYRAVVDTKGLTLFRMLEAVTGGEELVDTLGELGERSRLGTASFADLEGAVAEEGAGTADVDLGALVHDWLHGTHVPGYTLTRSEVRKIDQGWGEVVHQVIVRIRNGEPGRGVVGITVSGFQDEIVKAVEVEGGQEVEVGILLYDRPFRVTVDPFFARNQRALVAPLRVPEEAVVADAEDYVRAVDEDSAGVTELIVDNEDEGFTMPVRRERRFLRPALEGNNWYSMELPTAFGRYENGFRWKQPGDGAQPAVWTTTIPRDGTYDIAFYYGPRRDDRSIRWLRLADTFELTIIAGDRQETVTRRTDDMVSGWNFLARLPFEEGERVSVELTDRADGRLYADAIRWRRIDPDDPPPVGDEEVALPGFGGRGRGGGRGGIRGR